MMMISRRLSLLGLCLALFCGSSLLLAERGGNKPPKEEDPPSEDPLPIYMFTPLGTLGGGSSSTTGMNMHGDIVGNTFTAKINGYEWLRGFLNISDENGDRVMIDLQELFEDEGLLDEFDYENPSGFSYVTQANGINDHGEIVGEIVIRDVGRYVFVYSPAINDEMGNVIFPARLEKNFGMDRAKDINNDGDVVGQAANGDILLWRTDSGNVENIGTPGGYVLVAGINNIGQVALSDNPFNFVWRYTPGVGYENIPTLKGAYSNFCYSINDFGAITGQSIHKWKNGSRTKAFLYSDGTETKDLGNLGGLSSVGFSVNNEGDVVGFSQTSSGGTGHMFLYTASSGMLDLELETSTLGLPANYLGTLQPTYGEGVICNDSGTICGYTNGGPTYNREAYVFTRISP